MAQLVRASPCHGEGRRFESDLGRLKENKFDYGEIAQMARAHGSYPWCRGFDSPSRYYGILAQLGEHLPYKQRVIGSSPIGPIFARFKFAEVMPAWRNWQTRRT